MMNIRILEALNAGVVDVNQFSEYVCAIVGTEHYNDNIRQLRGSLGFLLTATSTLPAAGTNAQAFVTEVGGAAADPNLGGVLILHEGLATFGGGEVDGEELWVLFGLGIQVHFPLLTAALLAAGGDVAGVERANRAISLNQFSNSRDIPLGAVADWADVKGGATNRNGQTDCGSRAFRPIALKPSTRFHVTATVRQAVEVLPAATGATNMLFTLSYNAYRMNIRETFGGAQCANLFR